MNRANVERFVAAVYGVERREPAPAMTADGARIDQALLGRYVLRDGRRVPPWEWPPMRIDLELRPYLDAWLWPDPLSFIGAAANEGRS